MAITSGYFNSREHDRQYNAEEISRLFDGLINDGIFRDYMNGLKVEAQLTETEDEEDTYSMTINVNTGRCWFNHTWMLNDSIIAINIPKNEETINRIDAIVIDVDLTDDVRETTILYIQGSADNKFPTLIRESFHIQYPLAYITARPDSEEILPSDINDRRGKNTVEHEYSIEGSTEKEKRYEYGTPFSYILLGNAGLKTNIPGVVMEGFQLEKEDVASDSMLPNLFYGVVERIPDE